MKIYHILEKIDLYPYTPQPLFNGKKAHSTSFSQFITIMTYLIAVFLFAFFCKDALDKNNPYMSFYDRPLINPVHKNYSTNDFNFLIAFLDKDDNPINVSKMNVTSGQFRFSDYTDDKGLIKTRAEKTIFQMEDCTENHLPEDAGIKSILSNINLDRFVCLGKRDSINFGGKWGGESLSELFFQITKSNNNEDILSKIKYLDIYVLDNAVDLKDLKNPQKKTLRNYFSVLKSEETKTVRIELKTAKIESDESFIKLGSSEIKNDFLIVDTNYEINYVVDDFIFFDLRISLGNKEAYYYRKYDKISTVLSNVVGIVNILVWVGFIFVKSYSQMDFNLEAALTVFNLKGEWENNVPKTRKTKMPTFSFLDKFLFTYFKAGRKRSLIRRLMHKFQATVDLNYVIPNFINYNRLKVLILNPEQNKLFDSLPKPILIDSKSIEANFFDFECHLNDLEKKNFSETITEKLFMMAEKFDESKKIPIHLKIRDEGEKHEKINLSKPFNPEKYFNDSV